MTDTRIFTVEPVAWDPWLPTVVLREATPEQIAVLEESLSTAKSSPYYLLLVHNVEVLRQRSRLFNAVMYSKGGLSRAERELASVATSRVNGCVYCASVHAQRYAQLTRQADVITHLLDEGVETALAPRERAIVDFSVKLTGVPHEIDASDLAVLQAAGLTELEILDLAHVVAMFAWANRLLQTLGEVIYD